MNYQIELKKIINNLNYKPKLLLHSCCGPCSTTVIMFLKDYFDITILYYNPNIEPFSEYNKRYEEQKRFIKEANLNINFIDVDYENEVFRNKVKGLENLKEGMARCNVCMFMRLEKTCLIAKELKMDYFATTLTVSPHKNSKMINKIGLFLENKYNIKYLVSDFKKEDGFKKSIEYSKEYNLYRQSYCGCLFGVKND